MTKRVRLEARYNTIIDQEMDIQIRFKNVGTESVNPEEYRIVFHDFIPGSSSVGVVITETGFTRTGISPDQGGLGYGTPTLLAYESTAHPPTIEAGRFFNATHRLQFQKISGLPDINPGGSVEGTRFRLRRTDNKQWPREDGNTGPNPTYFNTYCFLGLTATYAPTPRIILEKNTVDPGNPDSVNWVVETEYLDDGITPDPDTGVHPYGNAYTGSDWQPTYTDHLWVPTNQDTFIDNVSTGTNYGNNTRLYGNAIFNPLNNATRRTLVGFDVAAVLPGGATIEDAVVFVNATGGQDHTSDQQIDLVTLSGGWTEGGATWANSASLFSANLVNTWRTFLNPSEQKDNVTIWRIDPAYFGALTGNGFGLKQNTEATQKVLELYSKEASLGPDELEFHTVVKFDTGGVGPGGTGLRRLPVW